MKILTAEEMTERFADVNRLAECIFDHVPRLLGPLGRFLVLPAINRVTKDPRVLCAFWIGKPEDTEPMLATCPSCGEGPAEPCRPSWDDRRRIQAGESIETAVETPSTKRESLLDLGYWMRTPADDREGVRLVEPHADRMPKLVIPHGVKCFEAIVVAEVLASWPPPCEGQDAESMLPILQDAIEVATGKDIGVATGLIAATYPRARDPSFF